MKRPLVVLLAAVSLGALCGGSSAAAKELVLRPKLVVLPYIVTDCITAQDFGASNQFRAEIWFEGDTKQGTKCKRIGVPPKRQEAITAADFGGYYPEKKDRCKSDRLVDLYLDGAPYERREFGEFQAESALFSPWKQPRPGPSEIESWPTGDWELRAPRLSYRERVFKLNGEAQDEAKSYPAKIVCEQLTAKLGSN